MLTTAIPNEVAKKILVENLSPIQAWREYLHLTSTEVANRLGITPEAFAQLETNDAKLRKTTLKQIATAFNITIEQLDV